jgi:hypothetical protein
MSVSARDYINPIHKLELKFQRALPKSRGIQGGSNMTGTNCDLFTHKSSRSYLNHLVYSRILLDTRTDCFDAPKLV